MNEKYIVKATLIKAHGTPEEQKNRLVDEIVALFQDPSKWPMLERERIDALKRFYSAALTIQKTDAAIAHSDQISKEWIEHQEKWIQQTDAIALERNTFKQESENHAKRIVELLEERTTLHEQNEQLQRGFDARNPTLVSGRTKLEEENSKLREELEAEERRHLNTIDQRDQHEEALNQVYFLVTGRSPEWSNIWGQQQLIEEVDDAQTLLRNTIRQLEADCAAMREALESAKATLDLIDSGHEQLLVEQIDKALSTSSGQSLLDDLERYRKALIEITTHKINTIGGLMESVAAMTAKEALNPPTPTKQPAE